MSRRASKNSNGLDAMKSKLKRGSAPAETTQEVVSEKKEATKTTPAKKITEKKEVKKSDNLK